jgi:hypothetical protein
MAPVVRAETCRWKIWYMIENTFHYTTELKVVLDYILDILYLCNCNLMDFFFYY